ncbi:hypothetical protein MIND_01426600 [Mycena indigotica]|uniref:Uncharacterized protein n=1 Tax=Mycena indigotica TaxID=2126181 RepID=A0A8H6RXV3_9AGAR|nr:uncharacterized protein MIND_01426600 [Mycena indigotica]KAF7288600.1 hypothetical protein MIND_01426600 [Mycena indigotica]
MTPPDAEGHSLAENLAPCSYFSLYILPCPRHMLLCSPGVLELLLPPTAASGPLLTQVGDIVNPAVAQIAALAGQPVSAILASAGGIVDATGVTKLIQPVLATTPARSTRCSPSPTGCRCRPPSRSSPSAWFHDGAIAVTLAAGHRKDCREGLVLPKTVVHGDELGAVGYPVDGNEGRCGLS